MYILEEKGNEMEGKLVSRHIQLRPDQLESIDRIASSASMTKAETYRTLIDLGLEAIATAKEISSKPRVLQTVEKIASLLDDPQSSTGNGPSGGVEKNP